MKFKKNGKIAAAAIAAVTALGMSAPAFATDAATLNSSSTIPVQISATATTFDVTVPTSFPTSVDPATGETTQPDNLKITNNSSAPVVVSQIKVTNANEWKLGGFVADLRNADVDSNIVGVSVQPKGGRNAGTGGTALKTLANGNAYEQVLLDAKSDEWVLDAKDGAAGGSDELTINYDTNSTPVSETIVNKTVANIVITISWNK